MTEYVRLLFHPLLKGMGFILLLRLFFWFH